MIVTILTRKLCTTRVGITLRYWQELISQPLDSRFSPMATPTTYPPYDREIDEYRHLDSDHLHQARGLIAPANV